MDNKHCIESAVLQISYSSEELALSQHSQLESFAKSELLSIVDEAFSELSGPDEVLGIEKLEIDLGEISLAYFYEDFGTLLKEKIKELVESYIKQSNTDGSSVTKKVSTTHSEFEIICQLLQYGHLPWNADSHQGGIEKLMQRVIENNGTELIEFVRTAKNRNDLLARLSTQFSYEPLCMLLALIVQPRSAELSSLLTKMFALGSEHFSLNRNDIKSRVWADLFQAAFLSRSSKLSAKEIIARIIQVFSVYVPQRYPDFLERLSRISTGVRQNSEVTKLIQDFVADAAGSDLAAIVSSDQFEGLYASSADEKRDQETRARLLAYKARFLEAINSGTVSRLQPVWQFLRKESPQVVTQTLYTLGQSIQVRRNIARNFPDAMIKDVVELLEPTNYGFIEQVVNEPSLYLRAQVNIQMPESEAKKSLWEFTLTYLLVERGSRFNKKSYIGSVMTQLAANLNIRVVDLYQSILALLQPISSSSSVYADIVGMVSELQADLVSNGRVERVRSESKPGVVSDSSLQSTVPENSASQSWPEKAPPDHIVDAVRLAFAGTDLSELEAIWSLLLGQYSEWFTLTITNSGRAASVRRNIARSFSNQMFEIVIRLIEPSNAKFLAEVIHRSTTKPPVDGVRRAVAQKTKRAVREFTLAYLLIDRGSEFNKKAYLTGLIKELAAHENMSTQEVLQAILESVDSAAYKNGLQQEMLALLQDVYKGFRTQAKSKQDQTPPKISLASVRQGDFESSKERSSADGSTKEFEEFELIRAYLLYEKLVAEIRNANGAISYHVVRLIHELIEHYPWIFHRFNQEVSSGQLSLVPVIVQLPKSLQKKLVISFFTSIASRYRFSLTEFETYLDAVIAASASNRAVYGAVLARLISNRFSSLDELFEIKGLDQSQTIAPAGNLSGAASEEIKRQQEADRLAVLYSRESSTPLSLNQSTSNLIKAYLLGQLDFSDQDKGSIVSTLELLLSSHPGALAMLLKESLVDRQAAHRLVDLLPESLLVKLLLLLRPDDHTKSILYADLMTMAAVEVEKLASGISGLLHLTKWQFVFDYMVIEGRRFNEVSFVRMFSKYLQARSTVSPKTAFVEQLSRSVGKASVGGAHAAAVRIAMILGSGTNGPEQGRVSQLLDFAQSPRAQEAAIGDLQQAAKAGQAEEDGWNSTDLNQEDDTAAVESIYIDNAGLVLLAPYIPRYFDMLGLLENNKFKNREAAERGVHLLQYLLNESTDSFEYQLVLNKLLCGVDAGVPIVGSIEITSEEKAASESLLNGVIGNWPILKNTSIAGLRESFLQREAHLQLKNESWQLLVQSKAFDMLLDSLPWSYATIKLSWMKRPIQVDWR
ncbi:MAG: hypothetical protein ACI95C_001139 [Pseudohongiellaceae bacterium]|jgi:hypothetical protein